MRLLKLMQLFTESSDERTAEKGKEEVESCLPKSLFKTRD